jgi:hypothetical protein
VDAVAAISLIALAAIGGGLVWLLLRAARRTDDLVHVATAADDADAVRLVALLRAAGIPATVRRTDDLAASRQLGMDAPYSQQVYVRRDDLDRARAAIEDGP